MSNYYLLVEGVNIYANVLDTNQLSIIRGTSFLLKQAIDKISTQFKGNLKPISTGASSGLFYAEKKIPNIEDDIAEFLNQDDNFRLLTFIVESCMSDDLLSAKEQLYTQLRISQMQSICSVPDDLRIEGLLTQPDQLEGRRIAHKSCKRKVQGEEEKQLSVSVEKRLLYGRERKFDFYFDGISKDLITAQCESASKSIDKLKEYNFCKDFGTLASSHVNNKPRYQNLNNKIAIIYMDGNKFSAKQREYLQKVYKKYPDNPGKLINTQDNFDKKIQGKRACFLIRLLEQMVTTNNKLFQHALTDDNRIRLETLLWGGDEMLFVVPAWLGFDLLQYFLEQSTDWELDDPEDLLTTDEKKLTHAAGIVFCNAKTPIRNIRDLAVSLADFIKESHGGRDQNAWNYMVLESIDYPTTNNITDFNQTHYQALAESKPNFIPALAGVDWSTVKDNLFELINKLLPKRQLYRIVEALNQAEEVAIDYSLEGLANLDSTETLDAQQQREFRLLMIVEDRVELINKLQTVAQFFNCNLDEPARRQWLWIYLYQLWDYVCPQAEEE